MKPSVEGARNRAWLRFWVPAGLILVLAGLLRFQALDSGLPNLRTRPDEAITIEMTALPARGEFDLDWMIYPSAYVYLCWLWGEAGLWVGDVLGTSENSDYLTTLERDPQRLYRIGRALSATAGTAAVGVVLLSVRGALGPAPALLAGALLATNFLHARDSHALKTEALLSFWVVLTLHAAWVLTRRPSLGRAALAGLGVGAAMAAKYPGVLLLVPVYLACVLGSTGRSWRRLFPATALLAGLSAAALFLATSPYLVLNPRSLAAIVQVVGVLFPQVAELLPTLPESGSLGLGGLLPGDPGWTTFVYQARVTLWYGAGPVAALLTPLALLWGLIDRRHPLLLSAVFFGVWYLVMSTSPHLYARYLTPVMPVLAILEAGLLHALALRLPPRLRGALLAVGVAALCVPSLLDTLAFNRLAGRTDTRVLATRWMESNLPRGARVAEMGTRIWNWGVPEMPAGSRYVLVEPSILAFERARVGYLLTHDHELFSSTVDPATFARLEPRLRPLAEFDPRAGASGAAFFEGSDAYYIPFHGFGAVSRPGPKIRIYAFE